MVFPSLVSTLILEKGNVAGLGNPPDNGIISGGAVASTLVNSRIRDGCLFEDIFEKKRP